MHPKSLLNPPGVKNRKTAENHAQTCPYPTISGVKILKAPENHAQTSPYPGFYTMSIFHISDYENCIIKGPSALSMPLNDIVQTEVLLLYFIFISQRHQPVMANNYHQPIPSANATSQRHQPAPPALSHQSGILSIISLFSLKKKSKVIVRDITSAIGKHHHT